MPFKHDEETKQKALKLWLEGRTIGEIAKELTINNETVVHWAREAEIVNLNPGFRSRSGKKQRLIEYVQRAKDQGLLSHGFYTRAHKETGCTYRTLVKTMKQMGIDPPRRTYTPLSKEELKEAMLMLDGGDSVRSIAEHFGISRSSIYERIKRKKPNAFSAH
jgi:transposase